MSSLSSSVCQSLMQRLHERAKGLIPIYHRLSSQSEMSAHDKQGFHAWWLGAPDPNDFNTCTSYNQAFEQWMHQHSHLLE